jgi:hypothetical protein
MPKRTQSDRNDEIDTNRAIGYAKLKLDAAINKFGTVRIYAESVGITDHINVTRDQVVNQYAAYGNAPRTRKVRGYFEARSLWIRANHNYVLAELYVANCKRARQLMEPTLVSLLESEGLFYKLAPAFLQQQILHTSTLGVRNNGVTPKKIMDMNVPYAWRAAKDQSDHPAIYSIALGTAARLKELANGLYREQMEADKKQKIRDKKRRSSSCLDDL